MARGKKTGGRNFKKGQSGNPKGAPKIPEDVKEMRKLKGADYDHLANKFMDLKRAALAAIMKDPNSTALEMWLASIFHKGIVEGDIKRLEAILCRTIGKVPQPLQHAGPEGGPISIRAMLPKMSPEEEEAYLKKIQARINRTLGHEK